MNIIKGLYITLLATSLVLRVVTVVENYRETKKRKDNWRKELEEDTEENSRP